MLILQQLTFWLRNGVKRPSHGKLKLANSCWQTQVGVCERHKNSRQTHFYLTPTVCKCVFVPFTHTNLCLPTQFCQLKFAMWRPLKTFNCQHLEFWSNSFHISLGLRAGNNGQASDSVHSVITSWFDWTSQTFISALTLTRHIQLIVLK